MGRSMLDNQVAYAAAERVDTPAAVKGETAVQRVRSLIDGYEKFHFEFDGDDDVALYHLIYDLYEFAKSSGLDFDDNLAQVKADWASNN